MQSDSEKKKQNKKIFMKILSLTQIDQDKVKSEIGKFQEDYKNHGSGAILWAKEEYPNYMILISILFGDLFDKLSKTFLPRMKKVVDEYFKFHEDVKAKNPDLYQEEITESNELVFENTIQPMDILVAKDAYIKYFNRKFSRCLKTYKTQTKDYAENLQPIVASYTKKVKEKYNKLAQKGELNLELTDFNFDKEIFTSVKDSLRRLEEQSKSFPEDLQKIIHLSMETNKKIQGVQKETLSNIPELTKEFTNITNDFKEIYDVNDPSWAHQRLGFIKDVDSFHIHFTKFIARLFHIISHNNRDYAKIMPQIGINPKKHYSDTRSKLKQILKHEMKQKYPLLSDYLLSMFKYNKYRKIEAHEVPKIRLSNGIAYIPVSGTKEEVEMNLEEIKTILNTYSFFIKALNLVINYTP